MENLRILECDNFSIELIGKVFNIKEFSLSWGQVAYIYGLSDSGVSDLLLLFAGLHNTRDLTSPAQGKKIIRELKQVPIDQLKYIKLLSKPLYEYPAKERSQLIGTIFEDPDQFIVGRNVLEDFQYAYAALDYHTPDSRKLREYGLYNKTERRTDHLSGGEKHRLNCASVLSLNHKLIIADFSYSNLDLDFISELFKFVKVLKDEGVAFIIHGLPRNEVLDTSDFSLVLENGVLTQKTPDPDLYPNIKDELQILKKMVISRDISDEIVLEVIELGRIDDITQPVSFKVFTNEIVQIVGSNGCGKTTLGKFLSGMSSDSIGDYKFKENIKPSICMQNPERQFIHNKVLNEVQDRKWLEFIGLNNEEINFHPRALSRSKQKLLRTLQTLQRSQGLAILDEPTSGLDFPSKRIFVSLLNEFRDISILMFTHDEALREIGRILRWEDIVT